VNAQLKRGFDIAFSLLALLFLVPFVFPIVALAIKLESPGPGFFKQLRPGRNNQLFWCFKFRTMRVNNNTEQQATKNDRRITRVGAFLRKTSLDELPQFYNALLGDMSVVGPRPNLVAHLEQYGKVIHEYPLRHQITPGITGYAQISGYRGETKELHQMQERVNHDLWYIENWSLAFDLEIIGRTVWNAVSGEENAY
jgi:putative colanic acid biosynthesis UDP-glucose lipid carrier transferase